MQLELKVPNSDACIPTVELQDPAIKGPDATPFERRAGRVVPGILVKGPPTDGDMGLSDGSSIARWQIDRSVDAQ